MNRPPANCPVRWSSRHLSLRLVAPRKGLEPAEAFKSCPACPPAVEAAILQARGELRRCRRPRQQSGGHTEAEDLRGAVQVGARILRLMRIKYAPYAILTHPQRRRPLRTYLRPCPSVHGLVPVLYGAARPVPKRHPTRCVVSMCS